MTAEGLAPAVKPSSFAASRSATRLLPPVSPPLASRLPTLLLGSLAVHRASLRLRPADLAGRMRAEVRRDSPCSGQGDRGGEALFELKKTPTIEQINKDVTRHRYGDEAHLDSTVMRPGSNSR